jgi:signal transduction histidine kinase
LEGHGESIEAGLGLAIVKSIAQAHDGTLTLTPGRWRALRHGATARRATAQWQMTIRGIAARPDVREE